MVKKKQGGVSQGKARSKKPSRLKGQIVMIGLIIGTAVIGSGSAAWNMLAPSSEVRMTASTSTTTTALVCPEAGACDADAQKYCPNQWSGVSIEASWKLDLVRCLTASNISDTCRESLECRQTLNENLLTVCKTDKKKYCSSITPTPGAENLVDCLGANFSKLSNDCAVAWTAHEGAKP